MKCWDMKRILALPTCQEICSDKELEQIDFGKFDLGHPVIVACVQDIWIRVSVSQCSVLATYKILPKGSSVRFKIYYYNWLH